ncbi:MAG: Rieske (2Fe-2S) protein [Moraxellaceae bacterium]|nr:Rieske (2Fe-2S) protein [Moraxellaceae bacterium]
MTFVALEKLMFLEDGYRREFVINGVPLLLLQVEGQPKLIRNQCPHRGHALADGDLNGTVLRCPQHGWSFDVLSGQCRLPGPGPCLVHYPLVFDGNRIGVDSETITV